MTAAWNKHIKDIFNILSVWSDWCNDYWMDVTIPILTIYIQLIRVLISLYSNRMLPADLVLGISSGFHDCSTKQVACNRWFPEITGEIIWKSEAPAVGHHFRHGLDLSTGIYRFMISEWRWQSEKRWSVTVSDLQAWIYTILDCQTHAML